MNTILIRDPNINIYYSLVQYKKSLSLCLLVSIIIIDLGYKNFHKKSSWRLSFIYY